MALRMTYRCDPVVSLPALGATLVSHVLRATDPQDVSSLINVSLVALRFLPAARISAGGRAYEVALALRPRVQLCSLSAPLGSTLCYDPSLISPDSLNDSRLAPSRINGLLSYADPSAPLDGPYRITLRIGGYVVREEHSRAIPTVRWIRETLCPLASFAAWFADSAVCEIDRDDLGPPTLTSPSSLPL